MNSGTLPWIVVLLPLLGFLINAFFGARWTKEPAPVVEPEPVPGSTEPVATAPGVSPYRMEADDEDDPEKTINVPADTIDVGPRSAESAHTDDHLTAAQEHAIHEPHASHEAHHDPHLDPGGKAVVGWLATLLVGVSFILSVMLWQQLNGMTGEERRIFSPTFAWMPQIGLNFGLVVDPLSSLMMLIITGVGFLIHLYSIGYMDHDRGYGRYFSYLNLFIFFMLLLVMGSNLIVTFVGWEGVGLASYLLIGFYHLKKSANDAAKKAFIVNRVGDCAFLIGMFALYHSFGTLDLFGANGILTEAGRDTANGNGYQLVADMVPILLFLGAAGKSAQIPLYVWLPDAMEGPTPVSALIHAATMVTGGVFLLARTHALFLMSPRSMLIVAIIGLATAILAATIALTQDDIKKVLAYSTVSQLGYMFLACGVGAFNAAMFHVTTHAFFKALLFLGAGSVIHAMGGEQDMRKMGGLSKKIPLTCYMMVIGTIAISGIPPLSGFFSKDEILLNAFAGPGQGGMGHWLLWLGGWLTAGLTAFYMSRLLVKTFYGEPRYSEETAKHIHESPWTMTVPLVLLAIASIFGGLLNTSYFGLTPFLDKFLGSTVEWREAANRPLQVTGLAIPLAGASFAIAAIGMIAAFNYFGKQKQQATDADLLKTDSLSRLKALVYNKWNVDDIYDAEIVRPGTNLSWWLWRVMDVRVIDGIVSGIGRGTAGLANRLRGWQSGYVRNYALSMFVGVVLVVVGSLLAWRVGLK